MVVKQIPVANTSIDKNGKVLLYIESKGDNKELVSVPDTKNLTIDEASKLIKELGFEVSIVEVKQETSEKENKDVKNSSNSSEENTDSDIVENSNNDSKKDISNKKVFEQIPEAGVFIEKGSIIKIKVK